MEDGLTREVTLVGTEEKILVSVTSVDFDDPEIKFFRINKDLVVSVEHQSKLTILCHSSERMYRYLGSIVFRNDGDDCILWDAVVHGPADKDRKAFVSDHYPALEQVAAAVKVFPEMLGKNVLLVSQRH